MKPIIEVKGLSKEYKRGAQKEQYLSLREQVFKSFKPGKKKDKFWALEDINFDVYPGESLAIIGKNGAGKSTLLKILSKITPPTKGEIILRGRLASLLEVGTGFHSELTGRENIYLNGSILGLNRAEINRQFDVIVDFSGVEDFLDTPLKHYSSGMKLRLAFSVAAHLEPEILVIDEVLAVGDSTFQKKCLDKMTEVSSSGRTILFVSHNMHAVQNLCKKGIILRDGIMNQTGDIEDIIQRYLTTDSTKHSQDELDCTNLKRKDSKGELIFNKIYSKQWSQSPDGPLIFNISLKAKCDKKFEDLLFGINIKDYHDRCVYHLSNIFINKLIYLHQNQNSYKFTIPMNRLKPGVYNIGLFIRANEEIQDWIPDAFKIEITSGNVYNFNHSKMIQGLVQPKFDMDVE